MIGDDRLKIVCVVDEFTTVFSDGKQMIEYMRSCDEGLEIVIVATIFVDYPDAKHLQAVLRRFGEFLASDALGVVDTAYHRKYISQL